jgi:hypothetical protein
VVPEGTVSVDGSPTEIQEVLLFLCEWDSRAKTLYYLKRNWPQRKSLNVGEENVQHPELAEWHKILLPPLHIKLGLMKNFVKAMGRTGSTFKSFSVLQSNFVC